MPPPQSNHQHSRPAREEIHVCLVSDQLLPNVIAALYRRPVAIHMVISERMEDKAKTLCRLFGKRGFTYRRHDGAPDTGLPEIINYAARTAATIREQHRQAHIVLNVTGGTKPMAMGFVVAFRDVADEVIYIDTAHGCLEYLDRGRPREALPNVLDIPTYLEAQGMYYSGALSDHTQHRSQVEARRQLTRFLAGKAGDLGRYRRDMGGNFFSIMNGLVQRALDKNGKSLVAPRQEFRHSPKALWREALGRISDHKLVRITGDLTLVFKDYDSARYLGGIWLEEYAWLMAREIGFDHQAMGVEGAWAGGVGPTNELDVLAISRNRLLVVECKTLRFLGDQPKDQDIITKIDSVGRKVGGLFGTPLLLSAQRLSTQARERCQEWRLALREGSELHRLREDLLRWKDAGLIG